MPAKRSAMRKIKEVLRLKFEARLSHERIAAATGVSKAKGAVSIYVRRAVQKSLSWPLPEALDESALERLLFEAILKAKLDQHPELFPGADTAAPTASRTHGNVRGAEYFRVTTTQTAEPSITEGDDDPCSSNPHSMH